MKLGFVSAILPEFSLEEVVADRGRTGYDCVELMCWPSGKAERRYAGVTHLDVTDFSDAGRPSECTALLPTPAWPSAGWATTPIPCRRTRRRRRWPSSNLVEGDRGRGLLGIGQVNTFVGRDLDQVGRRQLAAVPAVLAAARPVRGGARGADRHRELPDAVHARTSGPAARTWPRRPAIWRRMFADIPSPHFGLNFDPSHLVWQQMDYRRPIREFADRALPRPRQGRAHRPGPAGRRRHPRRTRWITTPPSCPGWATSTGAGSSRS